MNLTWQQLMDIYDAVIRMSADVNDPEVFDRYNSLIAILTERLDELELFEKDDQ